MGKSNLARLFEPLRRRSVAARGNSIELRAVPPSLRASDSRFVAEWADGSFALAGHSLPLADGTPFDIVSAPDTWRAALCGFGWLHHLGNAPDVATTERLQDLLAIWFRSRVKAAAGFGPAVTARRVLSWMAHADLLLATEDARFYNDVLGALIDDVRRLESGWRSLGTAGERLLALVVLAQAGLCIEGEDALQRSAEAGLQDEFNLRHWGRDGATLRSLMRQPDLLADLLHDLEALRLLYAMRNLKAPVIVLHAKTELSGALAGLMLGHGRPARLGAARSDPEARLTLASLTRHMELAGTGSCHNEAAGYARLVLGDTRVIVDVGAPLSSVDALAIEMSSGDAAMMVHDGCDGRTGAASRGTLIVATTQAPGAAHPPSLEPTNNVSVSLDDTALPSVDATHAGQARQGFVHRRRIVLGQGGRHLDGIDDLRPLVGGAVPTECQFSLRFVLHPTVRVTMAASLDQLDLTLSNDHRWRLIAPARDLSVEAAMFRDGRVTMPTLQILLAADTASGRSVMWQLTRLDEQAD